jgi:hypothetical protein
MKTSYFSLAAVVVAMVLLLNQCGSPEYVEPSVADGFGVVYETDLETYYDLEDTHWWYEDTIPLTITCELRDADGLAVASQTYTWTLPVYDGPTPTEPITVVEALPLKWEFDEPLAPGLYEERCRSVLGTSVGSGYDCDADGYCWVNAWRAPTCWGSRLRGIDK